MIIEEKKIFDQIKKNSLNDLSESTWQKIRKSFNVKIPPHFFKEQVLLEQVLPVSEELEYLEQEKEDPIGDTIKSPLPGIIHRYPNRVLLMPTYLCGMYCRFCFRKQKVSHSKNNLTEQQLHEAIDYIQSHPELFEVILSGGDPLVLSNQHLKKILNALNEIEHVKVIRIHTRMLTAYAHRINSELLSIFAESKKRIWLVAHVNHAKELNVDFKKAAQALQESRVILLSQSVLLKNVNASVESLVQLLNALVEIGIKPYYLHYPDLTKGTNFVRIPLQKAIELLREVKKRVSGLAFPQLMVDIPGGYGKIQVCVDQIQQSSSNAWQFYSLLENKWITVQYPAC